MKIRIHRKGAEVAGTTAFRAESAETDWTIPANRR